MNYNNQLDTETENETKILEEDNDPNSYSDIEAQIEFESDSDSEGLLLDHAESPSRFFSLGGNIIFNDPHLSLCGISKYSGKT